MNPLRVKLQDMNWLDYDLYDGSWLCSIEIEFICSYMTIIDQEWGMWLGYLEN